MNGRVSRLIRSYASTYARLAPDAGRKMERMVKVLWYRAPRSQRPRLEAALQLHVDDYERATHEIAGLSTQLRVDTGLT